MDILELPHHILRRPDLAHDAIRVLLLDDKLEDPNVVADDVSREYLTFRKNGFLQMKDLQVTGEIAVRLMATVDNPRELVVSKRFFRYLRWERGFRAPTPGEFSFNTLEAPSTLYHLSLGDELLPVAHTHAIVSQDFNTPPPYATDPNWDPDTNNRSLDATLWYKYYNGGTLNDLIYHFQKYKRKVPEMFIWHFIADYGRALAYIHNGTYRSRAYNITKYSHTDINLETKIRAPKDHSWMPISHHDSHESNVFFHYPSDEEKSLDPRLARYTDEFPQCILGDFGMANAYRDGRNPLYNRDTQIGGQYQHNLTDTMSWLDKARFGAGLKGLILASRVDSMNDTLPFHFPIHEMAAPRSDPTLEQTCVRNGVKHPKLATQELKQAVRGYSRELIDLIARFECIIPLQIRPKSNEKYPLGLSCQGGLREKLRRAASNPGVIATWPSNDFIYGTMIALADVKMDRYKKGLLSWDSEKLYDHRNRYAAPLNMRTEAGLYLDHFGMDECMPESFDRKPIRLKHRNGTYETLQTVTPAGMPDRGISITYPTGNHAITLLSYQRMGLNDWPVWEKRFHHWGEYNEETQRFPHEEEQPTEVPSRFPYPVPPEEQYWEEYDFEAPPRPDSPEWESLPDTEGEGPTVLDMMELDDAPQVGFDDDVLNDVTQATHEVVQAARQRNESYGIEGLDNLDVDQLLKDVFVGRRVLDTDQLVTLEKMRQDGDIDIDLDLLKRPDIAKELLKALLRAKPVAGADAGGGGTEGVDDQEDVDNEDGGGEETGDEQPDTPAGGKKTVVVFPTAKDGDDNDDDDEEQQEEEGEQMEYEYDQQEEQENQDITFGDTWATATTGDYNSVLQEGDDEEEEDEEEEDYDEGPELNPTPTGKKLMYKTKASGGGGGGGHYQGVSWGNLYSVSPGKGGKTYSIKKQKTDEEGGKQAKPPSMILGEGY